MAGTQRQYRQLIAGALLALASLTSSFATAALTSGAAVSALVQPSWAELSDTQKQTLAPLEKDWDQLESPHRIKWLGVAERYPSMQPEEQARMQKQMLDWARLTPEERKVAREKYKNLKQVAPDKKEAIKQKWNEYQELSEDEKQQLKQKAAERKPTKAIVPTVNPVKPLSRLPALKLAPTVNSAALTPASSEDWPNIIPGPVPPNGTPLFPLPAAPKATTAGK